MMSPSEFPYYKHRYKIEGGFIIFKINQHNRTEMEIVRLLAFGDGIITGQEFLDIGTRTMFSKYRVAGLIKEMPNAEKGTFQITDSFKKAYRAQICPNHKFANSGSPSHAKVLTDILRIIPSSAQLSSGETLKKEFEVFQKSIQFQKREQALREQYRQEREAAKVSLEQAKNPMEKFEALSRYNEANKHFNADRLCSPSDLKATLSRNEIDDLLTSLHDRFRNDDRLTPRQQEFTRLSIATLQQVQASMTIETVEILIEGITDSYGNWQIEQKENFSRVTETPIIYFAG